MNIDDIKREFPIFDDKIQNNDLVYLDSANSSQKPRVVVDRIYDFYTKEFSNVGRSVHYLAVAATNLYENTKSYQLIKSVIDDDSKSVYKGKIYVDSKAQKTDGYQLSKAVLLNEQSEFNAKPELEIYADDVKCSHGSASGSLNENSIFYLMSRGLNYKQSKELLINGFMLDVVEKITDSEIKNLIKNMIGLKE